MKRAATAFLFLLLLFGHAAFAQGEIKGTVKDEKGPLQGVSVLVKHTTRGTSTDVQGNFSVRANSRDTLVFSYTGFATQELVVGDQPEYFITLSPNAKALDDVVVV